MFISPDGIKFYLQYINIKNNDKKNVKQTRRRTENANPIALTAHLCFCMRCFNSKLEK